MAPNIPTEEEVLGYMESLSNWGRWGPEDELGCLNFITPAKRIQAAQLVRDGVPVTCSRPITTEMAADTTFQVQRYMVDSGEGRDTDSPERRGPEAGRSGVHRHGLSRPDNYPYRQPLPLLLAEQNVQWPPLQHGHVPRGSPGPGHRSGPLGNCHSGSAPGRRPAERQTLAGYGDEPVFPEDLEAAEEAEGVRVEPGRRASGAHGQLRAQAGGGSRQPGPDGP